MPNVDVYFFQYSKKLNSTAQPTLSSGTKLECIFREGYDVLNPDLELDLRGSTQYNNPRTWNYCYIPDMARYYWITDWAFTGGMWLCGTTEDLLASHKTAIGTTQIFAQRLADRKTDAGTVTDGGITDTLVPTIATPSWGRNRASSAQFVKSLDSGTYVIGVINDDNAAAGSVAYYALTPAGFKTFRSTLMGGGWVTATAEMSADTVKAILNPIQYITSCMWFPFDISHIYNSATGIHGMNLGWWTLAGVGYWQITATGMYRFSINISVPVHPQYGSTSQKMLRCAPFSTYILHLPYFGSIAIDYEDYSSGTVGAFFEIDIISGRGSVQLYNGTVSTVNDFPDLRLVYQTSCQVATPIQLSQVVSDTWAAHVTELQTAATLQGIEAAKAQQVINIVSDTAKAGASTANAITSGKSADITAAIDAGIDVGKDIASAVVNSKTLNMSAAATSEAGLYASYKAAAPRVTSQGANGSLLGSWCPVEISAKFLLLSDTSSSLYSRIGYTAGWMTQINKHTGYVQGEVSDFTSSGCLKIEADAIKAQIEAGLYYE